ncbi:MAG: hypothetical protein AAGA57_07130 [Planctomycetota bacterium]
MPSFVYSEEPPALQRTASAQVDQWSSLHARQELTLSAVADGFAAAPHLPWFEEGSPAEAQLFVDLIGIIDLSEKRTADDGLSQTYLSVLLRVYEAADALNSRAGALLCLTAKAAALSHVERQFPNTDAKELQRAQEVLGRMRLDPSHALEFEHGRDAAFDGDPNDAKALWGFLYPREEINQRGPVTYLDRYFLEDRGVPGLLHDGRAETVYALMVRCERFRLRIDGSLLYLSLGGTAEDGYHTFQWRMPMKLRSRVSEDVPPHVAFHFGDFRSMVDAEYRRRFGLQRPLNILLPGRLAEIAEQEGIDLQQLRELTGREKLEK